MSGVTQHQSGGAAIQTGGPENIPAGESTDELFCLTDLYSTLAHLTGASPTAGGEDSFDYSAHLRGARAAAPIRDSLVHHSGNGMFAIRRGPWKLITKHGSGGFTKPANRKPQEGESPGQLYHLEEDPGERVNVWDKENIKAVEKGILNSGLGINPVVEGTVLRLPIPELNEERRKELAKLAGNYAENARIAVRNVRKDGMDKLKKMKGINLSEDDHKLYSEEVQSLTDKVIKDIDTSLEVKQDEIMKI